MRLLIAVTASVIATVPCAAQDRILGAMTKMYASVDAPVVAITHVKLVDGTGTPAKTDQTVVIRGEKIAEVGPSAGIRVPAGAQQIDGTGKTLIPGLIGLHDHMYYGGMRFMGVSYPRLFLSAGVTTIRTTGSVDSYQELNLKRQIDSLLIPGPEIVVTGPYLQGVGGGLNAM